MPTTPWAKLKTPEVVYVTTRPVAAMANPAPRITPNTVYCRNSVTVSFPYPSSRCHRVLSSPRRRTLGAGGDVVLTVATVAIRGAVDGRIVHPLELPVGHLGRQVAV